MLHVHSFSGPSILSIQLPEGGWGTWSGQEIITFVLTGKKTNPQLYEVKCLNLLKLQNCKDRCSSLSEGTEEVEGGAAAKEQLLKSSPVCADITSQMELKDLLVESHLQEHAHFLMRLWKSVEVSAFSVGNLKELWNSRGEKYHQSLEGPTGVSQNALLSAVEQSQGGSRVPGRSYSLLLRCDTQKGTEQKNKPHKAK